MAQAENLISTGTFEGFTFADTTLSFFAPSVSLIGRTARDIRNANETVVSANSVFTYELEARKNGGNLIVTPFGTVSAKARGQVRGFILAGTVFTETTDEKKATHQFWVSSDDLRTIAVNDEKTGKTNKYITLPAEV
jgi:hypothetical protein